MKSIRFFSIFTVLIISVGILNAQNNTKSLEGTYMGVNEDYEYVFKLDDGTLMQFHEIEYEIEHLLSDEYINEKFQVKYVEEVIEEFDEENEEDNQQSISSSYIYRKIIELEKI